MDNRRTLHEQRMNNLGSSRTADFVMLAGEQWTVEKGSGSGLTVNSYPNQRFERVPQAEVAENESLLTVSTPAEISNSQWLELERAAASRKFRFFIRESHKHWLGQRYNLSLLYRTMATAEDIQNKVTPSLSIKWNVVRNIVLSS